MDFTTIIGYVLGLGLLYFGAASGGGLGVFINTHGLAIVVGGTIAAAMINSTARTLWQAIQSCVFLVFPGKLETVSQAIVLLRQLSEQAKTNGIMSLQGADKRFAYGFLGRAIHVGVTSGDAEFTRQVLEEDIQNSRIRHQMVQGVFRTAGTVSPMLGLLGTLIGIVQVLQQISDPSKVGAAMATALSTAFYGIFIATFFAVPVAGKLRERSHDEGLLKQVLVEGIVGIIKVEPPYLLEMRLRSFAQQKGVPMAEAPMRRKGS